MLSLFFFLLFVIIYIVIIGFIFVAFKEQIYIALNKISEYFNLEIDDSIRFFSLIVVLIAIILWAVLQKFVIRQVKR